MPSFDRYDICCAYQALEYDWNEGGMLQERPSNQRRKESIGVQLHRIGFKPAQDEAAGFEYLRHSDNGDNRAGIYVEALVKFGLSEFVQHDDDIARYVRKHYDADWVKEHFPKANRSPAPGR